MENYEALSSCGRPAARVITPARSVNLAFYPAPAFGSYGKAGCGAERPMSEKMLAVGQVREREATVHLNRWVRPELAPALHHAAAAHLRVIVDRAARRPGGLQHLDPMV